MTVAIVTDSAAALPADVVDALGVTVVPMWLQLDGDRPTTRTRWISTS